jgi:[acyl-carrier-protein] S-malonyltransferase
VDKLSAVVICPGRGTYGKRELGYLARASGTAAVFVDAADAHRAALDQVGVRMLDGAASYSAATHARGDNAAALIFASSYSDFLAIDHQRIEVVAVTGNSMGWYTTLTCAGVLEGAAGFELANAMGTRMHAQAPGGQILHTLVDEDWQPIPGRRETLLALADTISGLHVSIRLGGMIVLAGTDDALSAFEREAPRGPGRFPLRLPGHAAFHTPLMDGVAAQARATLPNEPFRAPRLPMIDGQGRIWRPNMSDPKALWEYTLGAQVTDTYDFTRAIAVAVREFAPDCLIILGPGETLGGAVIQSLLSIRWHGWTTKAEFIASSATSPFVISMGRPDQRLMAISE